MVRKFKLIKEYPRSPKLGTIMKFNSGWGETQDWITDHPKEAKEFWEELKEKEYEILEIDGYSGHYKLNPTTGFMTYEGLGEGFYTAEHYLNSEYPHYIHSIRRLSDGEIFQLGDTLVDIKNKNLGSFTLKKIEFEVAPADKGTGKLSFVHDHKVLGKWIPIKNLEHSKEEPLFITEDGVDIYEGDSVYHINQTTFYIYKDSAIYIKREYINKNYKQYIFSTKEAAEKWVDENKPKYSKNDMMEFALEAITMGTCFTEWEQKQNMSK